MPVFENPVVSAGASISAIAHQEHSVVESDSTALCGVVDSSTVELESVPSPINHHTVIYSVCMDLYENLAKLLNVWLSAVDVTSPPN